MLQTSETTQNLPTNTMTDAERVTRVRELNDGFRAQETLFCSSLGRVVKTAGVSSLPWADQYDIMAKVRKFDAFDNGNDPWREHDFGAFQHKLQKIFWKIDYYDHSLKDGSPDAADPDVTCRILTVMLASEY